MQKTYTIIFALLLVTFGYAQEIPILKTSKKQLGLSSLDIKVEVVGNIATTTYDMLFYNPSNTILEGELNFPLGEGHNVSRFALDINGKLREAVVVDKELGRVAFEQIVREGVDPALLEKGTGNNYKARIYPIPANGYKQVVLAYEQELTLNEGTQYYHLPLNFKNTLEDFKLEIIVFDQKSEPVIEKGKLAGLDFKNWEKNFRTKIAKKNFVPNKSLLIKIPTPANAEKTIAHEDYFYVYKSIVSKKKLRNKPKSITLFWDASLSVKDRNLEKELAFLDNYLSYLNTATINFISFSNTILSKKSFKIKNGNWGALKKEIEQTVYDGGTNYNVIFNNASKSDFNLLFSDGMASLNTPEFNTKRPLFIINSVAKSNHTLLNSIAEDSNGSYINLNTKTLPEATALMTYELYKFLGYTSNSKDLEVYPNSPVSIVNDFSIAGKNFKPNDKLVLNFGYSNEAPQKITITLKDITTENKSAKRIWAQKKLNTLEVNSKTNKTEITTLGLNYNLVTDYTSLIVLDNVRDYVRYKITPPKELLEEYNKILAEIEDKKKHTISEAVSLSRNTNITNIPEEGRVIVDSFSDSEVPLQLVEVVEDEMEVSEDVEVSYDMDRSTINDSISNPKIVKYREKLIVKDRPVTAEYIKALEKTKTKNQAYQLYLTQRKDFLKTPAYYVDISNYFQERFNERKLSFRILSNIPESDFDNYELLKVFGYQLQYNNQHDLAVFIFERILELRPEDSQSYRDLALAYEKTGKCQEALDLYNSIITGDLYKNNNRRIFEGLSLIAKNEIKHLIELYKDDLNLDNIEKTLLDNTGYDLRIVIDWNHNDTDIDLHIIDPNLEECYYKHQKTKIGGNMSPDMTQGFGPEEFTLPKAKKGDYFIKVKYYGDRYQKEDNPTFMKVTIFKHYNSKKETIETKIIRLTKKDDQEIIAKLSF